MAITVEDKTPKLYKRTWRTFQLLGRDGVGTTGSFSGRSWVNAVQVVYLGRYVLMQFAQANGPDEFTAAAWPFSLPDDYLDGTDIKVQLVWAANEADSGDVRWEIGLAKETSASVLGGDTDTEFVVATETVSTATKRVVQYGTEQTFGGSSLLKDEQVAVMVHRESKHAADTSAENAYVIAVKLRYESKRFGDGYDGPDETDGYRVRETPTQFREVKKEIWLPATQAIYTADTRDGDACTVAASSILFNRWIFTGHAVSLDECCSWEWIAPEDIIEGADVVVTMRWAAQNTDTGDVIWKLGMCTPVVATNEFSDDADGDAEVEFLSDTVAAPGVLFELVDTVFTFSGTNIIKGGPVCFALHRNGLDAGDTQTASNFCLGLRVEYASDLHGSAA